MPTASVSSIRQYIRTMITNLLSGLTGVNVLHVMPERNRNDYPYIALELLSDSYDENLSENNFRIVRKIEFGLFFGFKIEYSDTDKSGDLHKEFDDMSEDIYAKMLDLNMAPAMVTGKALYKDFNCVIEEIIPAYSDEKEFGEGYIAGTIYYIREEL